MFIAILTYIRPLAEIDVLIPEHIRYLDRHYATGMFIASGRLVPRTGGVILIAGDNRQHAIDILEQDPFHREHVATFELIEFTPAKMQPGFEAFLEHPAKQR